jgi:hypothetical protein
MRCLVSTGRLARWLGARLAFAFGASSLAAGLLVWLIATAESGAPPVPSVGYALRFIMGAMALAMPFCLFLAVVWTALRAKASGTLSLLQTSGVAWRRLEGVLASWILLFAVAGALLSEAALPALRNAVAPLAIKDLRQGQVLVIDTPEGWSAYRTTPTLARLRDVWAWQAGTLRHWQDVAYDGQWRTQSGESLAVLPPPEALVAARPGLFEFLATREILAAAATATLWRSYAGLIVAERSLRPLFWWLWLLCMARSLLRGRHGALHAGVTAPLWLLAGVTLTVMPREWAWQLAPSFARYALLAAPSLLAACWLLAPTRRSTPAAQRCD